MNNKTTHQRLHNPAILIKPQQLKRLNVLLTELGLQEKETKMALVQEYSERGFTSSKQLTEIEADKLIKALDGGNNSGHNQRRKLLSIGYELHWHRDTNRDSELAGRHPSVINKYNVNQWCIHRSAAKKAMEEMTLSELNAAVSQLKIVLKKEYNKR